MIPTRYFLSGLGMMLSECAAQAQALGQGGDDGIAWWRFAGALILCLALAVGAAFALKARMGVRPGAARIALFGTGVGKRRLEMVESLRVKPQLDLVIVRCDGRELLLATSGQTAQLIERLGNGTDPA